MRAVCVQCKRFECSVPAHPSAYGFHFKSSFQRPATSWTDSLFRVFSTLNIGDNPNACGRSGKAEHERSGLGARHREATKSAAPARHCADLDLMSRVAPVFIEGYDVAH